MTEDPSPTPEQKEAMDEALRNASPSWEKEGQFHRPQPVDRSNVKRWDDYKERVTFKHDTPDNATPAAAQPDDPVAASNESYGFQLVLDSIDNGASTLDVLVLDGEINDALPTGMTGADDYTLTLATPGTEIWAVITYDTSTLDITSRSLDFGATVPDSTLGTLYVPIGFVDWAYDGSGNIIEVVPKNRHCGDINVQFIYGQHNAAPALFAVFGFDPIAAP